jgi:hypothetical protein
MSYRGEHWACLTDGDLETMEDLKVVDPERFGEFKTTKQFQSWAEAFVEGQVE